jgi:two-component system response regulator CpxR
MVAPPPKLLIVDDDGALAAMLVEYLEMQGFQVTTVGSGERALKEMPHLAPDLLVLDVGLPGIDGFETLRRLRLEHAVPVIMLTARGEEQDRIAGLMAGADDYLPKPFNPMELAARVRAVLKRSSGSSAPSIEESSGFGNLVLHDKRREVRVDGSSVPLTATELRVLEALLQRQGEVLSRAELTEVAVGRPLEPYDRSIDTHVSNLRRKFERAGSTSLQIRAVRGTGYELIDASQ